MISASFNRKESHYQNEKQKMKLRRWDIQRKKSNATEDRPGPSDKQVHQPQMPCACTECGENLTHRPSLQRHSSCHVRPYKCTYSEKSFIQRSQLMTHLKRHTKQKVSNSSFCDPGSANKVSLASHKKSPMGKRLYKCTGRNKSFTSPYNLDTHRRTHTGERPYQCTYCEKCFSQIGSLCKHQRVHSGEKPYECTECGKHFNQSSDLMRHQTSHTGERPFQCSE
ncbi:zinc finger protein 501-like [Ambystoma mexicanum]|uniref:zinc finger protein 501-like n=1 Tax=Ambystoma mexicanum TaxID=8296 RepID=UPI0037E97959